MLIGFSTGLVVLWDLRGRTAEARFSFNEPLHHFCWNWDGKSFLAAHDSGLLVTWSLNQPKRPVSVLCPHGSDDDPGKSPCKFEPIRKVQWLPVKSGDPILVFAGGSRMADLCDDAEDASAALGANSAGTPPSITIMRGKRLAVMQMDYDWIDFVGLCRSPYLSESCDPYAVAVLLQKDLVVLDLLTPGYPSFENPYPMDLAISPVTACYYVVDCPVDLVPAFYAVGSHGKRAAAAAASATPAAGPSSAAMGSRGPQDQPTPTAADAFSSRKWPINGGEWGSNLCSYQELIITGHADGSVRFWDASGVTLNALYKVRTSRYFERHQSASLPCPRGPSPTVNSYASPLAQLPETDLAVRHICFCADSRVLLLAAARHVCLLSFCRSDSAFEIPVLDVCLSYEEDGDGQSTVEEDIAFSSGCDGGGAGVGGSGVIEGSVGSTGSVGRRIPQPLTGPLSSASSPLSSSSKELKVFATVRAGVRQWHAGYQPSFICRLGVPLALSDTLDAFSSDLAAASPSVNIAHVNPPPPISAIALTSAYSLLAVGNDAGIALVDYYQAVCLLSVCLPDLDASLDLSLRNRHALPNRFSNLHATSKSSNADQHAPILHRKSTTAIHHPPHLHLLPSGHLNPVSPFQSNPDRSPSRTPVFLSASPIHRSAPHKPSHSSLQSPSEHVLRSPERDQDRGSSMVGNTPSRRLRFMQSLRKRSLKMEPIRKSRHSKHSPLEPGSPLPSSVLEQMQVHSSSHRVRQSGEEMMEIVPPGELQLYECLSKDKVEKRLLVSPHDIWSVSPLLAKILSLPLPDDVDLRSCATSYRPSTADKATELRLQRHSGGSSQSSLDQPTAEGVRTLIFTEISGFKNDTTSTAHLWVGTSRGVFFTLTVNPSDDAASSLSTCSVGGSLFRLEGEAVSIAFLDSLGEICVPPATKWDLGSSAIPRLTLVPQQEEEEEDCVDGGSTRMLADQESNAGFGDSLKPTTGTCSVPVAKRLGPGAPSTGAHLIGSTAPPAARRDQSAKGAGRWSALKLSTSGSGGSSPATPVSPHTAPPVAVTSSEDVSSVGQHPATTTTTGMATDTDKHFVILCSEKQAQVVALPSRTCYHKVKITETSAVIRAEVVQLRLPPTSGPPTGGPAASASTSAFLACLLSNGHLLAFSLPSLRMLSDVDYMHSAVTSVPLPSLDQFTFGGLGHCIYMQSPSELVKITWAADLSSNLNEMHGELFLPCTMPEPPKRNFFTSLFSGNFTAVDRNELFGEQASGKPACGTAALLPTQRMDKLNAQSTSAVSDIARARNAAIERGERLAQLDIQTQEMVDQSKSLGKAASMLAAKYEKQDKWWGWPR
ncbi:Syntaxin-binding protein 5 [Sparganum proliferum]